MGETTADRVRGVIEGVAPSHAAFAEMIGMTRDKLSKSLRGARRFTSLELAQIADTAGVTVDWLLSGRAPATPALAARSMPNSVPDQRTLEDVAGRYTAAHDVLALLGRSPALPGLPDAPRDGTPHEQGEALARRVTGMLRAAGVPPLAELDLSELVGAWARLFGVDVAITRLTGGMDGLAWHADAFRLVVLATRPVWTRQRFTLAHELGHVLARDAQDLLVEAGMRPGLAAEPTEIRASAFAAALLMPEDELRSECSSGSSGELDDDSFSRLVTRYRVSPSALAARLCMLGLVDDRRRGELRRLTTAACHERAGAMEAYVSQSAVSNTPLPPVRLVSALFGAYQAGETTLRPLAALLETGVDELRAMLEEPAAGSDAPESAAGDPVFTP